MYDTIYKISLFFLLFKFINALNLISGPYRFKKRAQIKKYWPKSLENNYLQPIHAIVGQNSGNVEQYHCAIWVLVG